MEFDREKGESEAVDKSIRAFRPEPMGRYASSWHGPEILGICRQASTNSRINQRLTVSESCSSARSSMSLHICNSSKCCSITIGI